MEHLTYKYHLKAQFRHQWTAIKLWWPLLLALYQAAKNLFIAVLCIILLPFSPLLAAYCWWKKQKQKKEHEFRMSSYKITPLDFE